MDCNFYTLYDQKFSNLRLIFSITFPKDSKNLKCLYIGPQEVAAKRLLNGVNKWKNPLKTFFAAAILHPLWAIVFKSDTTSFITFITFLQGLQISKLFGHWTVESGGKRTIKRSEKVWRTNTHTDTLTSNSPTLEGIFNNYGESS